uniref:AMP-binding enzyme C-terminal domain-containing protein n=1 Tax=Megaselia scalaris TaxID=36166 RepID=T1H1B7_MEGSC
MTKCFEKYERVAWVTIDRIKEIMKSKGYHISPSEIEELVLEIPEVADICVVGIPDVVTINLPAALVIRKNGSTLSQEAIQKYVADKMPHYKHLTGGVYFVDSLPRTPSGKILRRKAKEIAELFFKEIN